MFEIRPIGYIYTPYDDDAPKRPDYEGDLCKVEIDKVYDRGLKDIDGFSYIYLICYLDRIKDYNLTAYPPKNPKPRGVFSTRSPHRPNPISLTRVKLLERKENILFVKGADLLNRTPVIDIKPYTGRIPAGKLSFGWLDLE